MHDKQEKLTKNAKNTLSKILHPRTFVLLILIALSVFFLVLALKYNLEKLGFNYFSYALSTYTLICAVIQISKIAKSFGKWFHNLRIIKLIDSNPIGYRLINDLTFRGTASIYQGLAINTLYAALKLITSFIYGSVWPGAVAVYYIMLCIIRGYLIYTVRTEKKHTGEAAKLLHEYKGCRHCGYLMLILNIGMMGMVTQMIYKNNEYKYNGAIIYLSAFFTFYILVLAIINVFKFRKINRPILTASKIITLSAALISLFSLQTAMIARFGSEEAIFRRHMNIALGSTVCLITFGMAVYMILNAKHEIKKLAADYENCSKNQ